MIHMIRVLSRTDCRNFGAAIAAGELNDYYGCDGHAVVSIHASNEEPVPWQAPFGVHTACFDDIIVPVGNDILPDENRLRSIAAFVYALHERPEKILLIAQCDGDRSRSGAVGRFALRYLEMVGSRSFAMDSFGNERYVFDYENPGISYNVLMEEIFNRLLQEKFPPHNARLHCPEENTPISYRNDPGINSTGCEGFIDRETYEKERRPGGIWGAK